MLSIIPQSGNLNSGKVTLFIRLKRSPILPDVPTIAEGGYPGFEASGWLGITFPAKTPAAFVERMHKEAVAAMATSDVREQLQNAGLEPAVKDTEAFRGYIKSELAKWTKLIKDAGSRRIKNIQLN